MVRNYSRKNNKINLKGGLNCDVITEQNECMSRKPECLWNAIRKKCLNNPNIPPNLAKESKLVPQTIPVSIPAPVPEPKPQTIPVSIPTPVPEPNPQPILPPKTVEPSPPEKVSKIPEKFKTTFFISPQLERLSKQLGVSDNMRDTIDPEISNEELDILLNNIKIESDKKDTLIVIANQIIRDNNIKDPTQLINIKIKVLLDNLAKKLCRCTGKIDTTEKQGTEGKKVSSEAVCRSSIFHRRGIDYITHDCGDADLDILRYNYKMGPLLRPAVNSSSNTLLRRHIPKRK